MNHSKNIIPIAAALGALLVAPTTRSEESQTLPEITVTASPTTDAGYVTTHSATATKTDTPLIETPQSISVITNDQLDSQEADTFSEALRYSAGIKGETFGLEDRGFDSFVDIRGFSSPIFRDGLQVNTPGFSGFNTETYLAERIEILRGPALCSMGRAAPAALSTL